MLGYVWGIYDLTKSLTGILFEGIEKYESSCEKMMLRIHGSGSSVSANSGHQKIPIS